MACGGEDTKCIGCQSFRGDPISIWVEGGIIMFLGGVEDDKGCEVRLKGAERVEGMEVGVVGA